MKGVTKDLHFNQLSLESDKHLIYPYSGSSTESNIKGCENNERIKEMVPSKAFDCSTDSLRQYHRKSIKKIMEIVHTDVRLYGVNLLLTLFHQSPLTYVISFNQNGGRIHHNL